MTLKPPTGDFLLTRETAARVPRAIGVYAAWLVSDEALREAGIEGRAPFLLYIGRAAGQSGLRQRLQRHAASPWWGLIDLLASRRATLPGWWAYARKNTSHRWLALPGLAGVAEDEGLAWQGRNLRWGWIICTRAEDTHRLEADLIAGYRPLLNVAGRGFRHEPRIQLRAIGQYRPERAWWLFHATWIALLTCPSVGWRRRRFNRYRVDITDEGWPIRLGEGTPIEIKLPYERQARDVLVRNAPSDLQAALTQTTTADEARTWLAAYTGNAFLSSPKTLDEALSAALRREPDGLHGPDDLPNEEHLAQLLALTELLPSVGH